MSLVTKDLVTLKKMLAAKEVSAQELMQSYLDQIQAYNSKINAIVTINDEALNQAKAADDAIAKGQSQGPLHGLPIAIKEMLCTKGIKTTAASKMLANYVPPYSATVVERLEKAGAIVIGKTNQDEFAMGSSSEVSHFGVCKNPWDQERVPGGSSGGSAAAVAAGFAPVAIGTDTGGSIRQPASFCGVTGVKPTYGRVSRYGIIAFASSLDQAGPMARSVEDCALIMEVISGVDPYDATTTNLPVPKWSQNLSTDVRGLRVGIQKECFEEGVDPEVCKITEQSIDILKAAGAEVIEIDVPYFEHSVSIYYLIATSEASSNLARYDGVRYGHRSDFESQPPKDLLDFYCRNRGEGFGPEVKRRIMIGTYALSSGYYDAYYKKACQVRRLLWQSYNDVFKKVDIIVSPVTTTPAFKIGERVDDPLTMYKNDLFTTAANLAGLPGLSVPAGMTTKGLPVGLQISAAQFNEQPMLNAALVVQNAVNLKEKLAHGL